MRLPALLLAIMMLFSVPAHAEEGADPHASGAAVPEPASADWQSVIDAARGQTVYLNAWGGSERINDYVAWAAGRIAERYEVTLRHVRVGDIAEVVARILAEAAAGRQTQGSVDLIWINGENFASMVENGLLGAPFTAALPNFALVDTEGKPTTLVDFTVPTEGRESPWGMAQLVFLYDTARVDDPPRSMADLLRWVQAHPGRFTYPQPPDFHGSTFLKQALIALIEDRRVLEHPSDDAEVAEVTFPLWQFLDALHPHLWRRGAVFPQTGPSLLRLLDDGELDIAFNFNPSEASAAIEAGTLPATVRTYVLDGGTLGNSHFLAIPFNASAREGAMVVANFMLSPEAQARKLDPRVWGDPTVLDLDRLPPDDRALFDAVPIGVATLSARALGTPLPEPHPSWVQRIEAEWQRRYGG